MSTGTVSAGGTTIETDWRWIAVVGALVVVLGITAVLFPFATGVSISVLLGAVLVVAGLAHLVNAFTGGGLSNFAWQALLAVVYTFAGISLLANPVVGLASLTVLLIAYFLVSGLVEIVVGVQLRGQPYWGLTVVSGVVSLVLAGLLWVGFPSTAAWALGLLIGLNLVASGLAMFGMAWAVRGQVRDERLTVGGESGPSAGDR